MNLDFKIDNFDFDDELNNLIDDVLEKNLLEANNIMQNAIKNVDAIDFGDLAKASIVEINKKNKSFLFYTNLSGSFKSRYDYSGLVIRGEGSNQEYGKRDYPSFANQNLFEYLTDGNIKPEIMPGSPYKRNNNL